MTVDRVASNTPGKIGLTICDQGVHGGSIGFMGGTGQECGVHNIMPDLIY